MPPESPDKYYGPITEAVFERRRRGRYGVPVVSTFTHPFAGDLNAEEVSRRVTGPITPTGFFLVKIFHTQGYLPR